jgi:hypothetical protein
VSSLAALADGLRASVSTFRLPERRDGGTLQELRIGPDPAVAGAKGNGNGHGNGKGAVLSTR